MSSIDERLAALDPAARDPYQPRHLDEMISRIVSTSPASTRVPWWRRLQVRLAGGVVVAGALAAGTLALVAGGPNLSVLAVQSAYRSVPATPGFDFCRRGPTYGSTSSRARPWALRQVRAPSTNSASRGRVRAPRDTSRRSLATRARFTTRGATGSSGTTPVPRSTIKRRRFRSGSTRPRRIR